MSDLDDRSSSPDDALDADSEETARIVIKDRPEVAACLNGLVFRGQEDAMIILLRAALVNMTESVLLDLEDEDALSACIADLVIQAERLPLAAKALNWEVQARRDSQAVTRDRSAGYRAEIDELLHGPLPPLALVDSQERDALVRRANASLKRETERGNPDAQTRVEELQAILVDTAAAGSPCFVTSLSRPRLAEWLARWSQEAFKEAHDAREGSRTPSDFRVDRLPGGDLSLLRDIQRRLRARDDGRAGVAAQDCAPILPRSGS
ncbi:MAG TPA: hypothetical protein VLK37_07230 [Solirubrobacterales bacterium]|nr:hypothetical protein [Solirubrobacterales bacterium]